MSTEYTVVFSGHPRNIKGNPFDVISDFGAVVVLSVGNVCEREDIFREALEEIADGFGKEAAAAQAALDAADAQLVAALKASAA